jgi:uncharacterized LabA/DUF88 family protein
MPAKQWMAFVDGENFAIRGQEILTAAGIEPSPAAVGWHERDVFLWYPNSHPAEPLGLASAQSYNENPPLRSHYYTSVQGDEPKLAEVRERLRALFFHPDVFKKEKGRRSKRVDITLARDMLSDAYQGNYELAVLIAGDADYLPLVEEVQRRGRQVALSFFGNVTSDELRLQADRWWDLTDHFVATWKHQADRERGI